MGASQLFVLDVPHGREQQAKLLEAANDIMREFRRSVYSFYRFPEEANQAYKREYKNHVQVMDEKNVFDHLYYRHPWKQRRCSEPVRAPA